MYVRPSRDTTNPEYVGLSHENVTSVPEFLKENLHFPTHAELAILTKM